MYGDDSTHDAWLAREEELDRHMDRREREFTEEQDLGLKRAFFAAMDALDRAMEKEVL